MKRNLFRLSRLGLAALVLVILILGAAGEHGVVAAVSRETSRATDAQADALTVVSARDSNPQWKMASRPWTKEEMLAAKPYPIKTLTGEPARSITPVAAEGTAGLISSVPPEGAKLGISTLEDQSLLAGELLGGAAPLGYSYPAPFSRWNHFQAYTRFPYVTTGVLFFKQYGVSYRCSAASIGNYAIWTAGHCAHAGNGSSGGWSYDVVFVPAYKNGTAPKGSWVASNVWTLTPWYNSGDLRFDSGGMVLFTNASGSKISQVVGNLGFAYNHSRIQHWIDLGYPVASPFTGKYLVICAASHAYNDSSMGSPATVGIGCDMTGGSSGGPWILNFKGSAGTTNYLNGNNSYRYVGYPKEMFSPYFGTGSYNLWSALVTDTP